MSHTRASSLPDSHFPLSCAGKYENTWPQGNLVPRQIEHSQQRALSYVKKIRSSREYWRLALLSAAIVVILPASLLFLAIWFERLLYENFLKDIRLSSSIELIEAREDIEKCFFDHILLLQKLTTYVESNPDLNQEQFASYVRSLDFKGTDIINHAAAPDLVVRFIYPVQGNEDAIGLDYRENAEQLPGVLRAMENSSATVTGPVDLVQGGRALIFRQPAFVASDGAEGAGRFWGIVSIVADYDTFLQVSEIAELAEDFDIMITADPDEDGSERLIYGNPVVAQSNPIELDFDVSDARWRIIAVPRGGWPDHSPTYLRDRLVIVGIGALLVGLVWLVASLAILQRRSQLRLSGAIDAMDDGFAMYDSDGTLIAFNAKYTEIYEATSDRITHGTKFEDIIRRGVERGQLIEARGREEEWVQERLESFYGPDTEFEQELSNGRYILASDRALKGGGRVCVRTDVTQLRQAIEKAEAANRAKSEFMNTLSHELRTPLTVILGLAGLARRVDSFDVVKSVFSKLEKDEVDAGEIRDAVSALTRYYAETMEKQERSAKHLLGLVNDMLDFAKVETGSYHVEPEICDIGDILSSVHEQARQMAEDKGLQFEIDSENGQVYCDKLRTTQILINLVANAIKFTPDGRVGVRAYQSGDTCVFEVSDTGPGIAPGDQARVFDAFEQLDASDARKHRGVGLGLSISRSLAVAQDGSLKVESEPGVGSTFILRLPAISSTGREVA